MIEYAPVTSESIMTGRHEIATVEDLERILDEYPEIRERIRRKLLTDEERELPRIVAQLAEDVRRLTEAVAEGFAQVHREIGELREGQQRLEGRQERLEEGQQRLMERFQELYDSHENLRGTVLEQTAARRLLPRITQELRLRCPQIIKSLDMAMPANLLDALDRAAEEDRITMDMAAAVAVTDLIMQGVSRDEATPIYVLTEVSGTLNHHDIARARERATALETATGQRTLAAVAAVIIPTPQQDQASAAGVSTYLLS